VLLRSAFLVGASTSALLALPSEAAAQSNDANQATQPAQPTQTAQAEQNGAGAPSVAQPSAPSIVVTGLRSSLQKNLDIKRDSAGIVDAISAEDIGKFPDSNVASALQRIPGVSISRGTSSLGGVPTTTGDATAITVRGFGPSFNETLYDGREISSGTSSRGFDFSTVGADFVGELDVLKTPDASLSAGAIGATINIKYPKPFDHPGFRLVGSLSGSDAPGTGKVTPSGGLLMSDTFADDTIGILADFAYSDNETKANHVNIQGWEGTKLSPSQLAGAGPGASTTPSINGWYAQDYGIYQEHTDTQRLDGRFVMQWHPSDAVMVTLNDNFSREKVVQNQYGYSIWFNGGSLTNIVQNGNGTVTNFNQPNTPTDFQGQVNSEVLQNNEYGLNVKWDATSRLQIEADADRSQSWLNPNGQLSSIDSDVGYGYCNPTTGVCTNTNNVGIMLGGKNGLPVPTQFGPGNNQAAFLNPSLIGSHVLPITSAQNKDTITQFRLQGTWTDGDIKIRIGGQYVADHFELRSFDDFTNNDWQAYSGYGPASNSPTGVSLPASFFGNSFSTAGFIPGMSGALPPQILQFNPYQVLNYLQGLGNPQTKNIPGFNNSVSAYNGIYSIVQAPGGFQNINEDTWSGYLTVSDKTTIFGMPLMMNFGLRGEISSVSSSGLGELPLTLIPQVGDATAYQVSFGPQSLISGKNHYAYVLPNLDLGLSATDRLKIRFDASRTLTRPPLGNLNPVLTVPASERVGALVASGGNVNLLPYLSNNLDLGVEWYYGRNSYFSIDGFVKYVSNFVVASTTQQAINNMVVPTTGEIANFAVSTQTNGPSARVQGIEIALQHVFGNSGFGFQANGTLVGTNKPYNPHDISLSGFAVTGLANSANFVAFYDKKGFQARVAVNWRDNYLDHFGQAQNNSIFGSEPTFVKASTQVDFSSSYTINKHFDVFFEALNLNNAIYQTYGRFTEQTLDTVAYGRRFTLGAHFRF